MRFVSFDEVAARIRGKSVAVVGSAPSVLENKPGHVDAHDVVVRVNNYKLSDRAGYRTDIHFSFYGGSIKKTAEELRRDGVTLCMCKCPDAQPLDSDWHERNNKREGIDFRYIYRRRRFFWFCDTYVPGNASFLEKFNLLDKHIPTTGFSAILDMLECGARSVYLTGFDFFSSGKHNVNEPWRAGDPSDPIGHRPDLEARWIAENAHRYPVTFDAKLASMLKERAVA